MSQQDAKPAEVDGDQPGSTRSRLGWYLLLVFLLVASLIGSQFISAPLRIARETTYVTQPLTPDGERVDYFAAIEREFYPANLATEENGYRLIFQRLGPAPDAPAWQIDQICEKLGLDPVQLRPDVKFEEPDTFLRAYLHRPEFSEADAQLIDQLRARYRPSALDAQLEDEGPAVDAEELLSERLRAPWTGDDLPMMAQWLEQNNAALDVLTEAVAKSTLAIPLVREDAGHTLIEMLWPEMQRTRSFARGLAARANYRIGTGDLDGAINDVIACKRLGRHVGHGVTIVDLLVGIAVEGIADSIGLAGSLDHPPTRDQLQRLVGAWDELPPRSSFAEHMLLERFTALEIIQSLAHDGELSASVGVWFRLPMGLERAMGVIGLNWNLVAHRINAHYDALVNHRAAPITPRLHAKLLVSRAARSEFVADELAALFLPALDAIQEAVHRCECAENMKRIAVAMLLYERDHGTLPPPWTVSADGTRLHSWRTLLLPYLGQQELYGKIRLDEPWDSEHNRTLHEAAVACYQCPSAELGPGRTTYAVVVGPQTAFNSSGQGRSLNAFGPQSGNMIVVVERRADVCWMDPAGDANFEEARAGVNVSAAGIGSQHPGGAQVGLRSAAVQYLPSQSSDKWDLQGLLDGTSDRVP
ncbi:MAG: DUF1559 domain-containing protein [Pirellulaceae bacterium]|nr:DUF1559 domain-containing protein [Pirellulaceae bacterium]